MSKEELTGVKEKLHKTDNVKNSADEREPSNKKELEMLQE